MRQKQIFNNIKIDINNFYKELITKIENLFYLNSFHQWTKLIFLELLDNEKYFILRGTGWININILTLKDCLTVSSSLFSNSSE